MMYGFKGQMQVVVSQITNTSFGSNSKQVN
jgi:hypothetical protein